MEDIFSERSKVAGEKKKRKEFTKKEAISILEQGNSVFFKFLNDILYNMCSGEIGFYDKVLYFW